MSQLMEHALYLADRGWHVFPLLPRRKRPAIRDWESRATTDAARIARCWSHDDYNIGLATGPSGLVVVDLDQPKTGQKLPDRWNTLGDRTGADVFARLARHMDTGVPETWTVTTPSGGRHLYFAAPAGIELRNTTSKLGPLVDTRAHGGYVVAPGSVAEIGAYELYDDTDPADLPAWLVRALSPQPSPEISRPAEIASGRESAYVRAALRNEAGRVANAPGGQQNHTLYTAALALGRLVAGGAVDEATVRNTLHTAMSSLPNTRTNEPWTAEAIDTTIRSAFRTATTQPRHLTDRSAA